MVAWTVWRRNTVPFLMIWQLVMAVPSRITGVKDTLSTNFKYNFRLMMGVLEIICMFAAKP